MSTFDPSSTNDREQWPLTRASLLARLRVPDNEAWNEFVGIYGPLVLRFVRARVPSAVVEDLAQTVFVRLCIHLPRFQYDPGKGRFRGWLGQLIRNEIVRWFVRNERDRAVAVSGDLGHILAQTTQTQWDEAWYEWALSTAFQKLRLQVNSEYFVLFEATWTGKESSQDAAVRFGVPARKVHKARFVCFEKLHQLLDALLDDHPQIGGDSPGILEQPGRKGANNQIGTDASTDC